MSALGADPAMSGRAECRPEAAGGPLVALAAYADSGVRLDILRSRTL